MLFAFISCADISHEAQTTDSHLLWIVNRHNPLDEHFKPHPLAEYQGVKLHAEALDAFLQMKEAMQAGGVGGLRLQSAYRSYDYQRAIFDQRVKELMNKGMTKDEATYKASQSIQRPGASEHQTGLALDVSINGILDQSFAETDAGKWLDENCHHFGFIIRYPQSKTEITKIIYEPWHLRYIGNPHAYIIKEMELTLEEYWCYIKSSDMYVAWGEGGNYTLVIYANEVPNGDGIIGISSSAQEKETEYIITMKRTYPNIQMEEFK